LEIRESTLVTLTSDLFKIAENHMERGKREKALLETLRSTESDENAWKATSKRRCRPFTPP
jgi:hypothetical protein